MDRLEHTMMFKSQGGGCFTPGNFAASVCGSGREGIRPDQSAGRIFNVGRSGLYHQPQSSAIPYTEAGAV